jgi:hypothetical protein
MEKIEEIKQKSVYETTRSNIIIFIAAISIIPALCYCLRLFMSWEATAALIGCYITLLSVFVLWRSYHITSQEAQQLRQREYEMTQREIYQRLELASIDLFRFECQQPATAALLWDKNAKSIKDLGFQDRYTLNAYVFQILNLFEMAIRFRKNGTMDTEAFGSWVIWMCDLASNKRFQELWEEMKTNYVGLLQEIFNKGIEACKTNPATDKNPKACEYAFFQVVGGKDIFDCKIIREWHKDKKLIPGAIS